MKRTRNCLLKEEICGSAGYRECKRQTLNTGESVANTSLQVIIFLYFRVETFENLISMFVSKFARLGPSPIFMSVFLYIYRSNAGVTLKIQFWVKVHARFVTFFFSFLHTCKPSGKLVPVFLGGEKTHAKT